MKSIQNRVSVACVHKKSHHYFMAVGVLFAFSMSSHTVAADRVVEFETHALVGDEVEGPEDEIYIPETRSPRHSLEAPAIDSEGNTYFRGTLLGRGEPDNQRMRGLLVHSGDRLEALLYSGMHANNDEYANGGTVSYVVDQYGNVSYRAHIHELVDPDPTEVGVHGRPHYLGSVQAISSINEGEHRRHAKEDESFVFIEDERLTSDESSIYVMKPTLHLNYHRTNSLIGRSLSGEVLFRGMIHDNGSGSQDDGPEAFFVNDANGIRMVAVDGLRIPNIEDSMCYFGDMQRASISSNGLVLFSTSIRQDNDLAEEERELRILNGHKDFGIFSEHEGQIDLVAREGDLLPEETKRSLFDILRNSGWDLSLEDAPSLYYGGEMRLLSSNDAGQSLFLARVSRHEYDEDNENRRILSWNECVLFICAPGEVPRAIAAYGTLLDERRMIARIVTSRINENGDVAFSCQYVSRSNPNSRRQDAIVLLRDEELAYVIDDGDVALDRGEVQARFGYSISHGSIDNYVLNDTGKIAFIATVSGRFGRRDASRSALLITDSMGNVTPIVRNGGDFDDNGDPHIEATRRVSSLEILSTSMAGESTCFNRSGQLAVHLRFADGSEGIFVAKAVESEAVE